MRARVKRWFKRLLKVGGLFMLVGIGVVIGLIVGVNTAVSRQTMIFGGERPFHAAERFEVIVSERFEERIERQINQPIKIEIPSIPPIPPIPPVPPVPEIPRIIHIQHGGPSFFDMVNTVGTILASFGLIGLGLMMIVRGRRQIVKEKSPDSLK